MSTIKPDKLFCVIRQKLSGEIEARGGPFGPELRVIHDASRPAKINIEGSLIPGADIQDTLKITQLTGEALITIHGDVIGGTEDCVDVTRCNGVITIVVTGAFQPRGKHVAIIKGESSGVTLVGRIIGHGRDTDIELGGYYGGSPGVPNMNGLTRDNTLDLQCAEPIKLSVFRATEPKIVYNQAYKRSRFYELVYPLWLWFRERGIGK